MQSFYEINVSQHGRHLFATAPHSAVTREQYTTLVETIRAKFPKAEGYDVSATYWDCKGKVLA